MLISHTPLCQARHQRTALQQELIGEQAGQIDEIGNVGAASYEAKTWLMRSRTLCAHQLDGPSAPRQ